MGEFDLIERFFKRPAAVASTGAVLGIGDDCALLQPTPGMQLAVSSDMLVEGRHFLSTVNPAHLGHKALAVNLSDLAACGAKPLAFTLALSMPRADAAWLEPFSRGLLALADAHGCALVGGDTTQGPLNICITVFGEVPPGQALLRSGARAGDDLYVSGTLGDARLALEVFRGALAVPSEVFTAARARMEQPTPRVALGQALRQALGDKRGIGRYGFVLPMDETLATVALDFSGRPYLAWEGSFQRERVGDLPTELVAHFFRSLCDAAGLNLHLNVQGDNDHHKIEAGFKGLARALRQAITRQGDGLPSTKGVL